LALPRTTVIMDQIRKLKGARDPKCYATASRLDDLIYSTRLAPDVRLTKNDVQKNLIVAIWRAGSERAAAQGLTEVPKGVLRDYAKRFLKYGRPEGRLERTPQERQIDHQGDRLSASAMRQSARLFWA
jgi:hypothetical protein